MISTTWRENNSLLYSQQLLCEGAFIYIKYVPNDSHQVVKL